MIDAIIFHNERSEKACIKNEIKEHCPKLRITSFSFQNNNPFNIIKEKNPELIFMEIEKNFSHYSKIFQHLKNPTFETILIASNRDFVFDVIKYKISGYLLKPLNPDFLRSTVDFAVDRIEAERTNFYNNEIFPRPDVIGIPTMDGYEFLAIQEIVRCESYMKCTRVIANKRTDVISSYNIGEFIKVLAKHGFYSPHQSHIINLSKVKKYLKEGTIIMHNNSYVPVARRRRTDFLNRIPHL